MNKERLQKLLKEADKLFQEKKWGAAIVKWNDIIALLPDGNTKAGVYNNRGIAKGNMGNYADAIADYDQAIENDPKDLGAYNNRGGAKSEMGDHVGAIADYSQAIAINPKDEGSYYNRGNAKTRAGDYKGAIADYDHALKINPQYAEAYNNRGSAKSKMGNYEGSIVDYDRALEIAPGHKNAIHNRAAALAMQSSEKGREEIEAKYQAQLRAQQEQFDRNLQEQLRAQQEQFDRELSTKISKTEDISKELEYVEKREKYDEKLIRQKQLIEEAVAELRHWAKCVYGAIAAFGVLVAVFGSDPSPFLLFPFVIMGTLLLFPLGWRIRMLNRDKHKYWALREDADAKIKMARIILINPTLQKELIVKLFDHHDKRGSAHLIADWSRADTGGGNSIVSVDSDLKPGDKGGDA